MTTIPAHKPMHAPEQGHPQAAPHEHGHEHPEHLAHHWESLPQQFEAGKLGMWLFLATEVLLFGGLFCAYAIWRGNHPELFKYGSHFLNTTLGATNTVVLILSSLTMAWGVTAAQQNKQGLLKLMLVLTLAGATTFLVIKYFEYTHKFEQGWFPGLPFYDVPPKNHESMFWEELAEAKHNPGEIPELIVRAQAAPTPAAPASATVQNSMLTAQGPVLMPTVEAPQVAPAAAGPAGLSPHAELVEAPFQFEARHQAAKIDPLLDPNRPLNTHMFFNIYFMMTGLHGIHVLVGMIVITWLLIRAFKGHFHSEYFTPVDLGGLYWHIVDLIWIFLFPLFYLI